jgi:aryl-alcohol dehydrogenase
MQISAAVVRKPGDRFEIVSLELDEPRPDEVQVRMVASGVCHTDALVRDGALPTPMPIVAGHEGAGIVEKVGAAVTSVQSGDHVVLGFNSCGKCSNCLSGHPAYCETMQRLNFGSARLDGSSSLSDDAGPVASHFFGQSSFSTVANVAERSVVKVSSSVPLDLLGPLGCGIATGAGTVLNVLKPSKGDAIAIFGAGAVGTAALLAAVVAECGTIILVDVVPSRLELAIELGATHTINGRDEDVLARILEITGGGVKFAIETTGKAALFSQMVEALRPQGFGVLVGAAPAGTLATIDIGTFLPKSPTITSVIEGDANPQEFIPRLIQMWEAGKFPFDRLIEKYPFSQINEAFEASETGKTLKPVLVFDA